MINKYYICIVLLSVSIVLSSCNNNEKSIDDKNYEESVQEDSVIDEGVNIEDIFIDSVFREYVSKKYDKDKDGVLTNDEISNITEISINGSKNDNYQNLKSLKGIEQFRNLEKLTCCACKLDEIDVSKNTELEELNVGCQWPIGVIARVKNNKINIYSILLTKQGEILNKQKVTGSIKDSTEISKNIGKIFADYV